MLSPWARNFVQRWQNLSYIEIAGTRAELGRSAVGTITLTPPADRSVDAALRDTIFDPCPALRSFSRMRRPLRQDGAER